MRYWQRRAAKEARIKKVKSRKKNCEADGAEMRHWKTGTKGTLPADGREKERQRLQCFLFAPEDFSDPGAVFIVICPCPSRRYVLFPSTDATKRTERRYYTSDITAPLFYLSIWSHFLSVILCCQRCHNYNKTFFIKEWNHDKKHFIHSSSFSASSFFKGCRGR